MKKSRLSPSLASSLSLLVCGLTVLGASAVRAAECPATSPDRTEERRALAKEWFARAEAAENAGNDVEAVRNYACSMKMVAHAFTAFNLGRVAERSGDLELALKSYKAYLTLKADAPDKDEVQAKIAELEGKIREVKENIGGAEPAAAPPPASEEKPEVPVAPPPEEKPERPVKPSPIEPPPQVSEPVSAAPGSHHLAEWIVGGVAVVAGATWLTTYLLARSNMHTANTTSDYNTSQSAWSTAKTEAYTSYVAWPIALGAVIAEGVLLYIDHPWASGSDSSSDTSVGLGWTPGGLTLSAHGRF
jgi:tetratricopeptide (TPR) repeat protein